MRAKVLQVLGVFLLLTLAGARVGAQSLHNEIQALPFFKNYTVHRASSYDRSGANDDGNWKNKIQPGETRAIAELDGPGIITHIWITIAARESHHLKSPSCGCIGMARRMRVWSPRWVTSSAWAWASIFSMNRPCFL